MFAFLAALGPIGIGAAIIGTVATAAYASMKDDEKSNSESSNSDTKHNEEKNTTINGGIENYKENQKNRFKNNYGVDIKFVTKLEKNEIPLGLVSPIVISSMFAQNANTSLNKDKVVVQGLDSKFESITNLENEIIELENLVKLLDSEKTEVLNESI